MKTCALAAVGLFALGAVAPAGAADLPLYSKAPVTPVAALEWTGVYGGINGGGGLGHACWSVAAGGVPIDPAVSEGCHNASCGTVGAQFGYRWQKAHWVLGVESQGNWADFKGNNVSLVLAPLNNRTRIDSFGLFTGQLGYTVNSLDSPRSAVKGERRASLALALRLFRTSLLLPDLLPNPASAPTIR